MGPSAMPSDMPSAQGNSLTRGLKELARRLSSSGTGPQEKMVSRDAGCGPRGLDQGTSLGLDPRDSYFRLPSFFTHPEGRSK